MSDDSTSRLRLIAPPESEPVSVNEAKLFLRIAHDSEDESIARAITAAREACEQYLGCALLPQQWQLSVAVQGQRRVALPFGPASAIENVALGARTLAETEFRLSVDGFALSFDVLLAEGVLVVDYVAALADGAEALPGLLKQGLLHHVAAMLEQREGGAAMPAATLQAYQPYRRVRL